MSRLAKSAGLIGAATMTSGVLGVARETVLAALFGAAYEMDAFNVAFRIPNLLRDLFAEGAISAALVPTFTRCLTQRGRDAAWRLGNLVVNALIAITVACVIAGWIAAPWLARTFAPEYALVPGKLELTTLLIRIMLPFLTLIAIGVAMMGMLNALRRFFIPAVSPAMFNVA
jgi:putative peptidoglycan lipid II flippase